MSVGITRDEYNAIIGEYEATIKDLRNRLEQAEKERTSNTAAWVKIPEANLRVIEAENAALKQKLEAVKKWADTRQADSVVKLRKILDGE